MRRARLHPGPVHEGEGAGDGEGLHGGDGPGRGEEEQVGSQEETGDSVEAQVGGEGQLGPFRDDEVAVHEAEGPVEDADEDFEGGGADGEGVFEAEERWGGGEVGEEAGGEGEEGEGEANDGEVLEVPAVGVIDGGGVVDEIFEGVEEGGEAEELGVGCLVLVWREGEGRGGERDVRGKMHTWMVAERETGEGEGRR